MKKIFSMVIATLLLLSTAETTAQTYSFAFSQFTGSYTPVTGTSVYGSNAWNSNSMVNLPLGFNFNFQGQVINTVDAVPGIFGFPAGVDNLGFYSFFPLLRDTGTQVSASPVSYTTTGPAGNRIFIFQCTNAGFEQEYTADSAYSSAVSFQTWFYEADNSIELHMGPSFISNPGVCYLDPASPGPVIGPFELNQSQTAVVYSYMLTGNPASAAAGTLNLASFPPPALNATPASGTVYRFAQVLTGINEAQQGNIKLSLFPNPAQETAAVQYVLTKAGEVNLQLTDLQGRLLLFASQGNQDAGKHETALPTAGLADGIYLFTLVSDEGRITQRLTVKH